ncbi:MAG: hypothetical protein ACTHLK_21975, partial [Brucella intermedia]
TICPAQQAQQMAVAMHLNDFNMLAVGCNKRNKSATRAKSLGGLCATSATTPYKGVALLRLLRNVLWPLYYLRGKRK